MRRDPAAFARMSWPDENRQFSRFRDADSRTRGPGGGLDATDEKPGEVIKYGIMHLRKSGDPPTIYGCARLNLAFCVLGLPFGARDLTRGWPGLRCCAQRIYCVAQHWDTDSVR